RGIARGPDYHTHSGKWTLCVGHIYLRTCFNAQSFILGVSHNTDHGAWHTTDVHPAADRIFFRKKSARECLIDYHNSRSLGIVAVGNVSTANERHSECFQKPGRRRHVDRAWWLARVVAGPAFDL